MTINFNVFIIINFCCDVLAVPSNPAAVRVPGDNNDKSVPEWGEECYLVLMPACGEYLPCDSFQMALFPSNRQHQLLPAVKRY
jgi:hypothetical protein